MHRKPKPQARSQKSLASALILASGFWLLASSPASAQMTAAVSGRVVDATGAALGAATVTVKSVETGAVRTTTTGPSGEYRVTALPLGQQEVKAERSGFKSEVRTGIDLEVGQNAVVNFKLDVGEFAQAVTVTEQVPVVNTTTASVSGVVSEREVKDLPLNGRSFDDLITLNPSAINYSSMKSVHTSTSDGNTFSVGGHRTGDNLFLLNGIEYTGSSQLAVTPGGASGELLGIDAVREFNVLTGTYPAEYGKRSGAQVMVVTQSGTNAVHGSMFEFLRNSALDAKNYFAQVAAPPFRQNQFGGSLGGPLIKNRWFLFGNYEGFRQALAQSGVAEVPDDQVRQGLFPNASGAYVPVANLDPSMLKYMQMWPQQNGPELLVNGLPSGTALSYNDPSQRIREDFGTLRSDYTLRDRDSLSAAYTIDDGESVIPLSDPLFGSATVLRSQVASLQETHIFSAQMLNSATAGFSRAAFNLEAALETKFPADISFVNGAAPGGIVVNGGTTTTGAAGITSPGPNNAAGSWNRRNLFTYTDNFQVNKGMHQITLGAWFQRMQDNEDTGSRQLGVATFSSLTTLLQGKVSNFQTIPNPTELGWRSLFGAFYIDDIMRLRPNLTLEAGLRDEFTTGYNEVAGRAANYVTSNGVLQTDPVIGSSAFQHNNATHLLGPRLGLAWDPFNNGKTAIRAGFGTYYSLIDALAFLLNALPPYNGAVSFANVPLSSIVPIDPNLPPPPSCSPSISTNCSIFAPQGVDPNAKTQTTEEWNFTVEQELSHDTSLRVTYAGSHGYHGMLSVDPNTIPAQICASAAGCAAGGIATTASGRSTVPQGAQYIPVGTRPNPYLSAGFFWYTEGNSSYNALQTELSHRLTKGLQFRVNYTWSKNLDMNSGLTGAQAQNQAQMVMDRNDLSRDWGPSALNVEHQVGISGSWEIPVGRGKHWLGNASGVEDKLLGGWQLNGIATMLSGFPFTPQIGTNRSGDGDTRNPDRPSVNPDFSGPVILGSPNQWYDPNAFIMPAAGTWGNLGRETLTGPGLANLDVSLFKNTSITERMRLQFRAELFNILNHPNFGPPNAIVFSSGKISPTAGIITRTATDSREIQFGLKLIF